VIEALETSLWVKFSLYGFFSILIGAMVLNSEAGTIFHDSQLQGSLFALVVAAMAMLMYHLTRYFKSMSGETGIPYQNLINMYLLDCAKAGRKLSVAWKK